MTTPIGAMTDEDHVLALLRRKPRTVVRLLLTPELIHLRRQGLRLSPTLVDMERRGLIHHTVRSDGRWVWRVGGG